MSNQSVFRMLTVHNICHVGISIVTKYRLRWSKNDLVFLYKIINGLVDMETSNILKFSNFGGYNLRRHTQHISRQHIAKTHCRNNFFSYRVISYWNKLEEEVISSPNLVNFKIKLKKLRFLL